MATDRDLTNVNVPPPRAADPTNLNVPVHGTLFPSGITGADMVFAISQRSDLGDAVTAVIADSFTAPFDFYIRAATQFNYSIAATMAYKLYNNTQSQDIIASNTPTTNTAAAATLVAAGQLVRAGDIVRLLVTTSGGSGASKGLSIQLFATQLAGSTTNPV